MADQDNKRSQISSTPTRPDAKRLRSDLQQSINDMQGMESMDSDGDDNVETTVKATLDRYFPGMLDAPAQNSAASIKPSTRGGNNKPQSVEDIVNNTIRKLLPAMVACVTAAVKESSKSAAEEVLTHAKEAEKEMKVKIEQIGLLNKYETDRLEQYSRRETIRINGVPSDVGDEEEKLTEYVIELGNSLGVKIEDRDISVTHRVGKPSPGVSRPVLCKFVSRKTRDVLMRNKKKLKNNAKYEGKVYINDDLTKLRAKLVGYVKGLPNVKRVNVSNGKIHCNTKEEDHFIIDSPDDLFVLGIKSPDYARLGLEDFIFKE